LFLYNMYCLALPFATKKSAKKMTIFKNIVRSYCKPFPQILN
jgi:hypothetical protein